MAGWPLRRWKLLIVRLTSLAECGYDAAMHRPHWDRQSLRRIAAGLAFAVATSGAEVLKILAGNSDPLTIARMRMSAAVAIVSALLGWLAAPEPLKKLFGVQKKV